MKRASIATGISLCAVLLANPRPAAAAVGQYVLILLDNTGSMTTADVPVTGGPSMTRWQKATTAAGRQVSVDYGATVPGGDAAALRAYAIYTFSWIGDGQQWYRRVWPTDTGSSQSPFYSCASVFNAKTDIGTPLSDDSPWCAVTKDTVDGTSYYGRLAAMLDQMGTSQVYAPTGNTPLADGVCQALNRLRSKLSGGAYGSIILESDGEENWDSYINSDCWGPLGTYTPDTTHPDFNQSLDDWGLPANDTGDYWQRRVLRRATHLLGGTDLASWNTVAEHPTTGGWFDALRLDWRIDLHFAYYEREAALRVAKAQTEDVAPDGLGSWLSESAQSLASLAPSIPPGELAFFRSIGASSSRSQITEFAYTPGTVFGIDHPLVADVDNNGCTDQGDLDIMMSPGVWLTYQAVSDPNSPITQADITRDGWVSVLDRDLLFSHWGEGCVNRVPPPHYPDGPWAHCSEANAVDMGGDGHNVTVNNDGCLMVRDHYPSWWGTRSMLLQNASPGAYPVPFSWYNACSKGHGTGEFTGDWQTGTLIPTGSACATLIKLQGQGNGSVTLRYFAANVGPAACGNGTIEDGEECDDGHATSGDGCSATCQWEDCSDGVRDNVESDVDCGGKCLLGCANGLHCNVNADCRSNVCIHNVCTATHPPTCTASTARDLGSPGQETTVSTNACVMVRDHYPSWWGTRAMSLQDTTPGSYPVPFSWTNSCAGGSGADTFTGDWQAKTLNRTSSACATVISLQGSGSGAIRLKYYGQ